MTTATVAGFRVRIEDDLPTALNNAYPTVLVKGRARRVLSSEARAWKDMAIVEIRSAAARAGFSLAPRTPYYVDAEFFSRRVWSYDVDGRSKLLLDAISAALGVDDRYVAGLRLRKHIGTGDCTDIQIWDASKIWPDAF